MQLKVHKAMMQQKRLFLMLHELFQVVWMASRRKPALACHGLAHAGPARPEARALPSRALPSRTSPSSAMKRVRSSAIQ
eukprot:357523-Chlamydomonas_euryale.AAC.7